MVILRKNDIIEALSDFAPLLKNIGIDARHHFFESLLKMQDYGATYFAIRTIFDDGSSSLFSTNVLWLNIKQDEQFKEDFRNHASYEIHKVINSNHSFVSRCGDKLYTPFLERLEKEGVNNSILLYNLDKKSPLITYYMANKEDIEARDLILNNLIKLQKLQAEIGPVIKYILKSLLFYSKREPLLSRDAMNSIRSDKYHIARVTYLINSEFGFSLTNREIECLSMMINGLPLNKIADYLGISVSTVKNHKANILLKTNSSSFEKLRALNLEKYLFCIFKNRNLFLPKTN